MPNRYFRYGLAAMLESQTIQHQVVVNEPQLIGMDLEHTGRLHSPQFGNEKWWILMHVIYLYRLVQRLYRSSCQRRRGSPQNSAYNNQLIHHIKRPNHFSNCPQTARISAETVTGCRETGWWNVNDEACRAMTVQLCKVLQAFARDGRRG